MFDIFKSSLTAILIDSNGSIIDVVSDGIRDNIVFITDSVSTFLDVIANMPYGE